MIDTLRNGTYLREPDGAMQIYYSPYSFIDALANFRDRHLYDDGWQVVQHDEAQLLWDKVNLQPGEWVFIRGNEIL